MQNNNADKKLTTNITRATGISALRKIRSLVDIIDKQDRNNKKHLIIISIVLIALILSAAYFFMYNKRNYQHIQTGINTAPLLFKGVKSDASKNTGENSSSFKNTYLL